MLNSKCNPSAPFQFRGAVRNLAAGILVGLVTVTGAWGQSRFSVTDLGTLPGSTMSVATGLNDSGDVVGYCSLGTDTINGVGFVWHQGVMVSTGKLPGGIYSSATAINSLGVVAGDGDTGNLRPQSWVASPKGLVNIFPNPGGNTHVIGINDSGAICGAYTKSLSGAVSAWKVALWTPDPKDPRKYQTTLLPILVGPDPTFKGTGAFPTAFNQAGQAAGYATNELIGQHACFWNNDATHAIVDLGVYPGDSSSIGWGMNDLGQVVGESHAAFGSRAVVWNNDPLHTAIELPLLPGDNFGSARAVNSLGQAIGISAWGDPGTWNIGPTTLVLWSRGSVVALQNSLDSVTGAGWTLVSAVAINNNGQIVGMGVHNGNSRAFLLTPIAP